MHKLFSITLNYDFFTKRDINDIKLYWTRKEVIDLLNEYAKLLEENVIDYDKESDKSINNYNQLFI